MWPCIVTNFLIIKPTRCTDFPNLFWKWNSTCFGQFLCPSSGVIHRTLSSGICHSGLQTAFEQQDQDGTAVPSWSCCCSNAVCMTYTIAECTVNNSWWWTEELSEICRVSFQNKFDKLVHLVGFIIRKSTYIIVNKVAVVTLLLQITFEPVDNKAPVTVNYPINKASLAPI
jgi:hypothetical protein